MTHASQDAIDGQMRGSLEEARVALEEPSAVRPVEARPITSRRPSVEGTHWNDSRPSAKRRAISETEDHLRAIAASGEKIAAPQCGNAGNHTGPATYPRGNYTARNVFF